MATEFKINWNPIATFIENLLKKKIQDEGLVKSGKLIQSISVKSNGDGTFSVIAEEYFKYLDEKHSLSESILNSNELAVLIENEIAQQFESSLSDTITIKI